MKTAENHAFMPVDLEDQDPQELVCACGAKIARTGTPEQLTNTGWYFTEGPEICPTNECGKMRVPTTPPGNG